MDRVVYVHPLDPVVSGEVGKGIPCNLSIRVILLSDVLKCVPQEIAIQAFARERNMDPGPRLNAIRARNMRVVAEDRGDSLVENLADVG